MKKRNLLWAAACGATLLIGTTAIAGTFQFDNNSPYVITIKNIGKGEPNCKPSMPRNAEITLRHDQSASISCESTAGLSLVFQAKRENTNKCYVIFPTANNMREPTCKPVTGTKGITMSQVTNEKAVIFEKRGELSELSYSFSVMNKAPFDVVISTNDRNSKCSPKLDNATIGKGKTLTFSCKVETKPKHFALAFKIRDASKATQCVLKMNGREVGDSFRAKFSPPAQCSFSKGDKIKFGVDLRGNKATLIPEN